MDDDLPGQPVAHREQAFVDREPADLLHAQRRRIEDLRRPARGEQLEGAVLRVEHEVENLVSGHSEADREATKGTSAPAAGSNHHTIQAVR